MKQLYIKFNFALILIAMFSFGAFAQQNGSLWTKTTQQKAASESLVFRKTEPAKSVFYQLDINRLKALLQNAPQRRDIGVTSNTILDLPTANGKFESFRVMEASVMHPLLQEQYPDMRSYVGQGVDNPSTIVRFSLTPQGLNTMMFTDSGTQFIDPYTQNGDIYIVYEKRNLPALDQAFLCEVLDDVSRADTINPNFDLEAARNANDGQLRTYDLALACTIEYSAFHVNAAGLSAGTVAQKKAAVLTAMNVTMTRVNGIYEKELALTMVLVANNTDIIFIDSDSFDNTNANVLIGQSQSVIDATIGSDDYDIGHTFSTGGGGLASLNSPCVNGTKARGITGLPSPVGDSYDIDFVAHELGHQFGSNHTFNGNAANCAGGNRSAANAYEPGSGTTIMAYAGICSPQNVQNNSDDYFHQRSLVTIWNNISFGNSSTCPTFTPTGNAAPTAEAGNSFNIPVSTPYKLVGSSTDANGTASHTFTWEQYDLGPSGVPTDATLTGPMVRSFQGTTNPVRFIPRFQDVVANGGVSTTWEKLASVGRVHTYQLTVRDNNLNGGQTASDVMTVTTVAATGPNSGPFTVTSQNTDVTWIVGATETVTWNISNTTRAPISTPNVNILMSIDGGATFPFTLASNVPNDGSEIVTVPAGTVTSQARIIVEGAGNIFYDINNSNFTVINSEFELDFVDPDLTVCKPSNAVYNFTYNTFNGFSQNTAFTATGVPAGANVSFSPMNATANGTAVTMTVSNTAAIASGTYTIAVVGTAAATTKTTNVTLNVFGTTLAASTLSTPTNSANGVIPTPTLTWTANAGAQSYLVQISTDASFSAIVNSATVASTSYVPTLGTGTLYYWRVTSSNACATSVASNVFSFTTLEISCNTYASAQNLNLAIADGTGTTGPANGTPLITTINVPDAGVITSMTVNVDVSHTFVGDLLVVITHPDGLTEANVWIGNCGSNNNFDVTFDDSGAPIVCGMPTAGTYMPEEPLGIFNGLNPVGDWEILIADFFAGDIGVLNDWNVAICYEPTLGVKENGLSQFSVFPNPNNGEFTVKLDSNSGEDIKIDVYDIRGRKVFNSKYINTTNFNEMIRLDDIQAGMYLINVTDGLRTETKKIIVK